MTDQRLIIIRGYPGSGKTTVGQTLAAHGLGTFIDHNAILTFLANIVGNDEGMYDEIHTLERAMARKLLADGKSAIVARGFSRQSSIDPYLEITKEVGIEAYIFKLNADEVTLKSRVVAEGRKKDFNPTTSEEALSAWMAENLLEAVEDEYDINANESIEHVVNQIVSLLGSRSTS
ncbi:MAG: AAA family ATPase [Candidatus Saccharimonadales bacterium]